MKHYKKLIQQLKIKDRKSFHACKTKLYLYHHLKHSAKFIIKHQFIKNVTIMTFVAWGNPILRKALKNTAVCGLYF